ncbi:hypothetical protein [Pedobacter sp. SYSU D00535]|uniref:hypothetical protein n=1 Tax=Pedobacter sp. SYSU D00535 TaxID=2810308 RepID=UPI001A962B9A|nr:hypothetical protein [Pedobacter sp. SYSU D00535]
MGTLEVKTQVSGYLEENKNKRGNRFIQYIKRAYFEGKLDHNHIRKAVIDCFKRHDKHAILMGSMLLQLDNDEINELLNDKMS